ncbi:MAG TPA: formate dehydrogenase accessory sulfurtransferase FdhD [Anaerolineales bacterium]|nr:formate dehydrogenase accessory sulfurtransferase FdhD [Anaerolineales bacterium]
MENTKPRGTEEIRYLLLNGSDPESVDGEVVEEALACISVNGQEIATMMCSPTGLADLAVGFLYNERMIDSLDEVASTHVSENDCVDVWLSHEVAIPDRRIITAGCGGGVTFDDMSAEHPPLESDLAVRPEALTELMHSLQTGAEIYLRSRGIHTAVLATPDEILIQVEDVGRHNCLDKLAGAALRTGTPTKDRILLSSGRISSEMLNKTRRLEVPIVCSRTSPTSLSLALAEAWNITVVAYLRGKRMRVYTHPERLELQN